MTRRNKKGKRRNRNTSAEEAEPQLHIGRFEHQQNEFSSISGTSHHKPTIDIHEPLPVQARVEPPYDVVAQETAIQNPDDNLEHAKHNVQPSSEEEQPQLQIGRFELQQNEVSSISGATHHKPTIDIHEPLQVQARVEPPYDVDAQETAIQNPDDNLEHAKYNVQPTQQEATPVENVLENVMSLSLQYIRSDSKKPKMLERPGYGQIGRRIQLVANYFTLNYKNINFYHYDVVIIFLGTKKEEIAHISTKEEKYEDCDVSNIQGMRKGANLMEQGRTARQAAESQSETHTEHQQKRRPGKNRCRKIVEKLFTMDVFKNYFYAYDGQKNIYTIEKLPILNKLKFTVSLIEDDAVASNFEIQIQPVIKSSGYNIINLEPLNDLYSSRSKEIPNDVLMVFDTVLGHRIQPFLQKQIGRSFFMLNQKPFSLNNGAEIWYGYNQSVQLTERGIAVIVNPAQKIFHKSGPVIDYVSDLLKCNLKKLNKLEKDHIKIIEERLHDVKVRVTHLNYRRVYPVKGLSDLPSDKLCFKVGENIVTVTDYYKKKYGVKLEYGYLLCLHMRTNSDTTYIPMELCEIQPDQPILGKLSGELTSAMIKNAALPPVERFEEINRQLENLNNASGQAMGEFSLQMESRHMNLNGRVLDAPAIAYRNDKQSRGRGSLPNEKGTWAMGQNQLLITSPVKCSWIIISFARDSRLNLVEFADKFCSIAHQFGMNIQSVLQIRSINNESVTSALQFVKDQEVTFSVVVLDDKCDYIYNEIKYIGDIKLSLLTQCIKRKTVLKCLKDTRVLANVLLKVNSKLGGTGHELLHQPEIFKKPLMILGADVVHWARGYDCPSIASVVGSLDAHPSQYAVTCRVQYNPDEKKISQEIIIDLKEMVKSVLEAFKRKTRGKSPEKIVLFRDGVSDGQFQTVLETEIPMIQHACNEALDGFIPRLTYIIVQKRHQTRFRPQNPKEGVGRMGNVPVGTTVDRDVTHPVYFDFFICSHEGIQGTSRPAKYTVIFDENGFSADNLQKLCYYLCYTYSKCTRSISIPPPVMYADLACTRAKKYVDNFLQTNVQKDSADFSKQRKLPPQIEKAINIDMSTIGKQMFFI